MFGKTGNTNEFLKKTLVLPANLSDSANTERTSKIATDSKYWH